MALSRSITILLAEDHHLVREGFKSLLREQKDFELVAEVSDGLEAVQQAAKLKPHVLLLDLMLPRLNGLDAARQVREESPDTRIVILSSYADEPYVKEALRLGVLGYVLKDSTAADLVKAIRSALAGRRYLSPVLAERALTGYVEKPGEGELDIFDTLTKRERMVLQLAAEGSTSAEVAAKLFISPRTAETHRSNLMGKLGLRSQTDLVRYAIRKGVIPA